MNHLDEDDSQTGNLITMAVARRVNALKVMHLEFASNASD